MIKKLIGSSILLLGVLILVSCDTTKKQKPVSDSKVPYLDEHWVSVWADEFDGDTLDLTKWTYEIDGNGGGNNELQYYTDKNAEVSNGTLKIHGKEETISGRNYTSSRIVTKGKGDFRYGRIVTSAKVPTGRGTWPAIWMMPTESKYGQWPNSGEIDIMEYVGYEPNRFHSTLHSRAFNHKLGTETSYSVDLDSAPFDFHKFEIIWEPGKIESYINDVKIGTFKYTPGFNLQYASKDAFPFDQKFFLILNFAIGGDWGGQQGIDKSIFPSVFEIDYIRVYQKDYHYYDKEAPSAPTSINSTDKLKNSIYWKESTDDMGVDYYNVYLDGEFYDTANLSQITLRRLVDGQEYDITIEAVDFTGKVSEMSESFKYKFIR